MNTSTHIAFHPYKPLKAKIMKSNGHEWIEIAAEDLKIVIHSNEQNSIRDLAAALSTPLVQICQDEQSADHDRTN